ncbi:MAG: hypothetical protein J6V07_02375 [Clostridia bacterium]|nr:hypothetical protein [Clostridia bacterium]
MKNKKNKPLAPATPAVPDPPVPNRARTEMTVGDPPSREEKREAPAKKPMTGENKKAP